MSEELLVNSEELDGDLTGWCRHEKDVKKLFTKRTYEDEFNAYYDANLPSIIPWCEVYDLAETETEKADIVNQAADLIMDYEYKLTTNPKNGKQSKDRISEESMFMALFGIPAIDYTGTDFCNALCDVIVSKWHKQYPKNLIQRGKYEVLLKGFKKSILQTLFGRRSGE